jgi:cytochrome b6-f complex iron-sulfur subunit
MSDEDREEADALPARADPEPGAGRRDFLGLAITGTAAALGVMSAYPVTRFLQPHEEPTPRSATVGEAMKFPRGSSKTVLIGEQPVLVIRLDDGTFRAYVALCTHLQCVVSFSAQRKQIECPCHRGVYSLEGQNVSGPPPRPLTVVDVSVINGVVTVSEV